MSQYSGMFATFFGSALFGWLSHALYIRPNQLKIKNSLPPVVKNALQDAVDTIVPHLATLAENEATKLVTDVANKVTGK